MKYSNIFNTNLAYQKSTFLGYYNNNQPCMKNLRKKNPNTFFIYILEF